MKNKVLQRNLPTGEVSFNVIPLVDCIFLMIIFFILTSQMADPNVMGTVFLARPTESKAKDAEKEDLKNKIIVNVISQEPVNAKGEAAIDPRLAGQAKEFSIGTRTFALQDVAGLSKAFKQKKQDFLDAQRSRSSSGADKTEVAIIIRCDWRVQYADVIAVFAAAADAGIAKMNITVLK